MRLPWFQSDLHPHSLTLGDGPLPEPDLTLDLAEMAPPPVIHRLRAVRPEGAGDHLARHGFTRTRRTDLVTVPLPAPDLAPALPEGVTALWSDDAPAFPMAPWLAAHWQHYRAHHRSNPPADPGPARAAVFAGDDLIDALALIGPDGSIAGASSLRTEDQIGWTFARDPSHLPAVLALALRRATALGWSRAEVEADDDDPALWRLAATLPGHRARFETWTKALRTAAKALL
jgi:hypothetical protein